MNIIEELVKKYDGKYSEEPGKASNMINGRFTFQPQSGKIEINGTKISVNINAVGGAAQTAEPYRIVLHLEKNYKKQLEIFPKTHLKRFLDLFKANNSAIQSNLVNKKYSFSGDKQLISNLRLDRKFCKNTQDEKLYILIGKKYPKRIVLTPAFGVEDIEHFEKLILILKLIEEKIQHNCT